MHNRFSGSFTKGLVKVIAVVLGQVIADKGLASVFVDPLQYLIADTPISCAQHNPFSYQQGHTLYPAAYPRPGKREVNLRTTPASAYSLKTTLLKALTEATWRNVSGGHGNPRQVRNHALFLGLS
jgi:hypothetical protein